MAQARLPSVRMHPVWAGVPRGHKNQVLHVRMAQRRRYGSGEAGYGINMLGEKEICF